MEHGRLLLGGVKGLQLFGYTDIIVDCVTVYKWNSADVEAPGQQHSLR